MKKKAVETWVGYLIYLLFATITLSIVLYSVDNYIKAKRSEIVVLSCINSLTQFYDTINNVLSCTSCSINQKLYVPPECRFTIEYEESSTTGTLYAKYICTVYKENIVSSIPEYVQVIYDNSKYPYIVNISFNKTLTDTFVDINGFHGKIHDSFVCLNITYVDQSGTSELKIEDSDSC